MPPLFTLETPRARLTWSGPPSARRGAEPLVADADGVVTKYDVWLEEETAYPVLIQSLDGSPVSLWHRDPVVTAGLVSADDGRVVHGLVRFGSQAGRARFEVRVGDAVDAEVAVSVLPTKLFEDDVRAMRADVEASATGLAVAALRPTEVQVGRAPEVASVPVWLSALRKAVGDLAVALREIERRPDLGLLRSVEPMPSGRIRRPTSETRRSAAKSGIYASALLARPARVTSDTPAHCWLAGRLDVARRRLRQVVREERCRQPSARRRAIVADLVELEAELSVLRGAPVLSEVAGRAPKVPPLVLRRRPAYASAFGVIRQAELGLDLRAGSLDVATQDLAVVFETWVALATVRCVADALGVESPTAPFGIEARGTDVRLGRGQRNAVRLVADGVKAEIVYNPRFPAPPALLAQRPDLVLTVAVGDDTRRVVLDAKYRRDDSAAYRRRYGAAGPPEDALGVLHRYRDAIPGHVDLAVAVSPGEPDDSFYTSRLWTSLDALGVGAVPIRPGRTDALAALIAAVLSPDGPRVLPAPRGPTR